MTMINTELHTESGVSLMRQHQSRTKSLSINRSSLLLIAILSLCSLTGAAVWARASDTTAPSVSTDEISRHIKYLASDELQGRGSGTPGCERAAEYIAAQFKQYGLKTSTEGGYYQPFEFT